MQMHSYVYMGGAYLGNGFKLLPDAMSEPALATKLIAASAKLKCSANCDSLAPASDRAQLEEMVAQPLTLLGWAGNPHPNPNANPNPGPNRNPYHCPTPDA